MKKYFIITYGCQMNKSDSERMATVLENKGYKIASEMKGADLILVNMCSVRQSAVDRIYGLTSKLKKLKDRKNKLKIVLAGCILRKDRKKFKKLFDEFWNINDYPEIIPLRHDKSSVFVPISNGCNFNCSYCVVPFTRGRLVCRSCLQIIKEVEKAVKNGSKEIWLLGQNVNDYISEQKTNGKKQVINFAGLLKMVNNIPGNFKFLFISPHPKNFSNEIINALAKCEKFGKYLNLPLQSGDDRILKQMSRNYTAKEYKNLVKRIRKDIPGIKLSTDIIVGFPGETKLQFKNTEKLLRGIKFDWAYIAKYSPRSGTLAYKMKDNVPLKEKKRREKILREIVKKYAKKPPKNS